MSQHIYYSLGCYWESYFRIAARNNMTNELNFPQALSFLLPVLFNIWNKLCKPGVHFFHHSLLINWQKWDNEDTFARFGESGPQCKKRDQIFPSAPSSESPTESVWGTLKGETHSHNRLVIETNLFAWAIIKIALFYICTSSEKLWTRFQAEGLTP